LVIQWRHENKDLNMCGRRRLPPGLRENHHADT
jgi:hypothetical protein